MKLALLVMAMIGCAHTDAEIKTAKTAQYATTQADLFNVALSTVQAKYKVATADPSAFDFWTAPRFYSPEGDLQSPTMGDFIHMDNHSVRVTFHVQVISTGPRTVIATITPQTFQVIKGSPKPRELKPDDPFLPPFVLGQADELSYEIYESAHDRVAH
jgi:hypothetical protein